MVASREWGIWRNLGRNNPDERLYCVEYLDNSESSETTTDWMEEHGNNEPIPLHLRLAALTYLSNAAEEASALPTSAVVPPSAVATAVAVA